MACLRLKINSVRDLAFCRAEGGEEMSGERGILLGQLAPGKKKTNKAAYMAIYSSSTTARLLKPWLMAHFIRRKQKNPEHCHCFHQRPFQLGRWRAKVAPDGFYRRAGGLTRGWNIADNISQWIVSKKEWGPLAALFKADKCYNGLEKNDSMQMNETEAQFSGTFLMSY